MNGRDITAIVAEFMILFVGVTWVVNEAKKEIIAEIKKGREQ